MSNDDQMKNDKIIYQCEKSHLKCVHMRNIDMYIVPTII